MTAEINLMWVTKIIKILVTDIRSVFFNRAICESVFPELAQFNWDKIFKNGLWDSVFPEFAYLGIIDTLLP